MPSSGAAERNWSTFGYIHSKSRNRLKNERVHKLVYIYTNSNLLETSVYEEKWFDETEVTTVGEILGADGEVLVPECSDDDESGESITWSDEDGDEVEVLE